MSVRELPCRSTWGTSKMPVSCPVQGHWLTLCSLTWLWPGHRDSIRRLYGLFLELPTVSSTPRGTLAFYWTKTPVMINTTGNVDVLLDLWLSKAPVMIVDLTKIYCLNTCIYSIVDMIEVPWGDGRQLPLRGFKGTKRDVKGRVWVTIIIRLLGT